MELTIITQSVYCVCTPYNDGNPVLLEFLSSVSREKHEGSANGLLALFSTIAEDPNGPRNLPKNLSHLVAEDPKIYQFTKGGLRVLWFYGGNNNYKRIILCTHGFIKKSQKTPKREKDRAIEIHRQYCNDDNLKNIVFK